MVRLRIASLAALFGVAVVGCVLLVGGMGGGAAAQLQARGVQVVAGVPDAEPDVIAEAYVRGLMCCGTNACAGGHSHEGSCHDHHEHAEGGCHCANG